MAANITLPRPLETVAEREALAQALTLDDLTGPAAPAAGRWLEIDPPHSIAPDQAAPLFAGRTAGAAPPLWARGEHGIEVGETVICRVEDGVWWPGYGAVGDQQGRIFRATAAEARARSPDLSVLRGASRSAGEVLMAAPAHAPCLGPTAVFNPFGGRSNYGHFLLDSLSSLLMLEETGLLERFAPAAPPLKAWQRDLLSLAFPGLTVRELPAPVYLANEIVFATAMDHFLQHPNPILQRLRARMIPPSFSASAEKRGRRLYLSRRRLPQRLMVNEPALEAALKRRGFDIITPEQLSPRRQIELCARAEVIVAPVGAAAANALFAPPGCRVIEIVPEGFGAPWVASLCRFVGAEWSAFFCGPHLDPKSAPLEAQLRWLPRRLFGRYHMAYETPLEPFLDFLDQRL